MPHALIVGISESGKTTLALQLAQQYKTSGIGVLVLDPLKNPAWQADFISADEKEFLDVFWRSRSCMIFIDEAGEAVGRYNLSMQKTVTRGRHWGHFVHVISQRGVQINMTVRDQCRHLFLFCSSRKDGEVYAAEFNKPELAECSALLQGEYFHASRFGGVEKCRVKLNGGIANVDTRSYRGRSADTGRSTVAGGQGSETGSGEGDPKKEE